MGVVHLAVAPQPEPAAERVAPISRGGCWRGARARKCRGVWRGIRDRRGSRCRGRCGRTELPEPAIEFLLMLAQRAVLLGQRLERRLYLRELPLQSLERCTLRRLRCLRGRTERSHGAEYEKARSMHAGHEEVTPDQNGAAITAKLGINRNENHSH